MIEVDSGAIALIELALNDGATTLFPQAIIYDATGTPVGAPINLGHIAGGVYQATFAAPAIGEYTVHFTTYLDAGHTLPSTYDRVSEHLRVVDPARAFDEPVSGHAGLGTLGAALVAAGGHAGLNAFLDNLVHNPNNNLTTARLRVFPDSTTASAASSGGSGEGEILTLTINLATYVAGAVSPVTEILQTMRRTAS